MWHLDSCIDPSNTKVIHHLKVIPTINKDIYKIKLSLPIFKKGSVYNFIYN